MWKVIIEGKCQLSSNLRPKASKIPRYFRPVYLTVSKDGHSNIYHSTCSFTIWPFPLSLNIGGSCDLFSTAKCVGWGNVLLYIFWGQALKKSAQLPPSQLIMLPLEIQHHAVRKHKQTCGEPNLENWGCYWEPPLRFQLTVYTKCQHVSESF